MSYVGEYVETMVRGNMTKFVVVAGGVLSGVGKGVIAASLGRIFKEHGYKTTLIKIDPYINCDAGTLRPTEHGEVWVTEDGGEIDQDLGTYERFMDENILKCNNITTGQVYRTVIEKERSGVYLGKTVQFIPHITDEIKARIELAVQGYEIAVIEIGGTVGDYENMPFLYALKSLERTYDSSSVAYVLVTYLPIPSHINEMKTKPTQQAIRLLGEHGIVPDFIVCRSKYPLDEVRKGKIETFANIHADNVISAPDIETIYQMPLDLERDSVGARLLAHLSLTSKKNPEWEKWQKLVANINNPRGKVRIAIIGKYLNIGEYNLTDSYVSIYQALIHAGAECNVGIDITWINAAMIEDNSLRLEELCNFDGIIIPGGFGELGVEGKICAITYAREQNIPYLGLCYGFQLAVVEYARNVCNMKNAHTTEIDQQTLFPVITILASQKELLEKNNYGGSMRLGVYPAILKEESLVFNLYNASPYNNIITERHRHRYEVNPEYVSCLEKNGLVFSGYHEREDGARLMEFLELPTKKFFVATQAHPEFKSRLGKSSPLFYGFMRACEEHHALSMQSCIQQERPNFKRA